MEHNIKVYKPIIFSTIAIIFSAINQERKRKRGSGMGGNSKSG